MKYFSIDIETTGLDPQKHDILQIACIYDNLDKKLPRMNLTDHFVLNCKLADEVCFQTPALKMGMKSGVLEGCMHTTTTQTAQEVINELIKWILAKEPNHDHIFLAGKNLAKFDIPFLTAHNSDFLAKIKPRYILDPTICYMHKCDERPPSLTECKRRAGFKNTNTSHSALDDAYDVCRLIRHKVI